MSNDRTANLAIIAEALATIDTACFGSENAWELEQALDGAGIDRVEDADLLDDDDLAELAEAIILD